MTLAHWRPTSEHDSPDTLIARPFGADLRDIALDFLAPLDIAIGAVLERCVSGSDGKVFSDDEVGGWTVAKRRQGLLAVAVATNGPTRSVTVACADPGCAERIELELDLTAFRQDWRRDRSDVALDDGQRMVLRHPTPADLARIARDANDEDAEARLARLLLVGPAPRQPGWEDLAEAALSDADRLADLELRAGCPHCGARVAHPLALEPFLMAELAAVAARLLDEIHVLAMAYHWSEPEILALPEDRRRHYLARIQEAWAA
jgi:hypothetical protein